LIGCETLSLIDWLTGLEQRPPKSLPPAASNSRSQEKKGEDDKPLSPETRTAAPAPSVKEGTPLPDLRTKTSAN
jgi:hypothetical protein